MAARASFHLNSEAEAANLFFTNDSDSQWVDGANLNVLAVVEVAKIPLCLVSGPAFIVETDSQDLESWFSHVLIGPQLSHDEAGTAWWRTAQIDSQLGVLVSVKVADARVAGSRVTELLIYATRAGEGDTPVPAKQIRNANDEYLPTLQVKAIPLCSSLLTHTAKGEPTPPASPTPVFENGDALFLSPLPLPHEEVINEVPVRKRKSAMDFCDDATERRSKARRKEAVAPPKAESQIPTLNHRRNLSNSQHVSLQRKPASRSPSVASSRPETVVATNTHRSSLSRVQSVGGVATLPDIGAKNKDSISRIVMAGMRLYGLSQRRSKKAQSLDSPAPDLDPEDLENERKRDEDYKNIYHQAFKGTCFAFRGIIDSLDMQPMAEAIRDVVDRFLAIFCNDPLSEGLSSITDKLTPGGRKAFGVR